MRLKQVSLAAAISVVAGLTTATVGLTGPVAWADADNTAALPLSHYAHMVVDGAHQHLFFSQGAGDNRHRGDRPVRQTRHHHRRRAGR